MAARVLIAAHDLELRNHIRENIGKSDDIDVVGLARDGEEALQMSLRSQPDVALISDDIPGITGIRTCEMLN